MKTIELCESDATEQQSSILPEPLSSGYEHPQKPDAVRRHKSRFNVITHMYIITVCNNHN